MDYKFNGSGVFFTSDTHFNHTNIIRFCSRPFKDVEHMNETLIANWNRVVGPDNIVFHLGDFCLGGSAEWTKILKRLNGKIYLIAGNHDMKNLRQNYTKYFELITMQMYIEVDSFAIAAHTMIPGSFSAMCIQAGITPEKISLAFKCFSLHNMMWELTITTSLRFHSHG